MGLKEDFARAQAVIDKYHRDGLMARKLTYLMKLGFLDALMRKQQTLDLVGGRQSLLDSIGSVIQQADATLGDWELLGNEIWNDLEAITLSLIHI